LKAGEFADFVILAQYVARIPALDILKTEVLQTVVGGKTVYQRN
jgi:predicted amidohydrolase YtcJ